VEIQAEKQKEYRLMSIIYAYIISISFMNMLIGVVFKTGGMVINIGVICVIAALNIKQIINISVRSKVILFTVFIIAYYLMTDMLSYSSLPNNEFYFYFLAASFFGVFKCDVEKVLRYIMYISLLAIPFHNDILGKISDFGSGALIDMGRSFSMFPVFFAGIIHFFFFRRQGKIFDKICYIFNSFFLLEIILGGTRSIVLTAAITVFCLYLKNWGVDKKTKKMTLRLFVVMIAVALIYSHFYQILDWLNEQLLSFDIEANFIQKILRLKKEGDVSNGRDSITEYTLKAINESPFWGHGISTIFYNSNYRINYPHNFILQLFYDGGLLLAIPVLKILYTAIHDAFNGENRKRSTFLLYMLLICVPKMFFSTDMWGNAPFWLMIAYTLQHVSRQSKSENKEVIQ